MKLPPLFSHSSLLPLFAFSSLPFLILSSMFSRSLSIFNFVITTLLGAMPVGTLVPLDFSLAILSTWMTYLRRYTEVTLPSRPLWEPRTTVTSSSLRMGMARTYGRRRISNWRWPTRDSIKITLCFSRNSLLRGALMMTRRTLEGAVK